MKKKYLKEDLEYANKMLKQVSDHNWKLAEELDALRAEKRNRDLAQKIADAIGSGTIYATSVSITQNYDSVAVLEISLSGSVTSLYNLGNLFKDGI